MAQRASLQSDMPAVLSAQGHSCDALIKLFNDLFLELENTELVRGDDEPIYLPATDQHPHHRIIFAHGYFASALHEISHWCIAGPERRLLEDFGYWYQPDGRTAEQQAAFEQVEVKPQALEWMLAKACGFAFRISCDNLNGQSTDTTAFKDAVCAQVASYLEQGLSERPQRLIEQLRRYYNQPPLCAEQFHRSELDW